MTKVSIELSPDVLKGLKDMAKNKTIEDFLNYRISIMVQNFQRDEEYREILKETSNDIPRFDYAGFINKLNTLMDENGNLDAEESQSDLNPWQRREENLHKWNFLIYEKPFIFILINDNAKQGHAGFLKFYCETMYFWNIQNALMIEEARDVLFIYLVRIFLLPIRTITPNKQISIELLPNKLK